MIDWFSELISSNLPTKLVSVLVAIVLWFIVLGSRNTEVIKEVPIQIITADDIVAANDIPDKVNFTLTGPKAFLRSLLDRIEPTIRVDLTRSRPGIVTYRFFPDSIRVPLGVKVQAVNPSKVQIWLEKVKERRVPIEIELQGILPEGFRIVDKSVFPSNVLIRGAKSKIAKVSEVFTDPIDLTYLKHPVQKEVSLNIPQIGVQAEPVSPKVILDIRASTANYRMKKIAVKVLSDRRASSLIKSVTAFLRVDQSQIGTLNINQFSAQVDLRGRARGTYTAKVVVKVPDQVGLVKVVPSEIAVELK